MKARHLAAAIVMMLAALAESVTSNAQNMKKEEVPQTLSVFPVGEANVQYAEYFSGRSYLARLTRNAALNCPVSNVTFEPGCRNNWHSHTGGQILIAVGGKGYYQEKGSPARMLLPGDIVEIAPGVVHWHGAAPDSWFSHLAVECNPQTNENKWLDPVTDEEYAEVVSIRTPVSAYAAERYSEWYPSTVGSMEKTDPELASVFRNFAFGDTQRYGDLDIRTRILVTMASAIAMNADDTYRNTLQAALANGITPDEIKAVLYHAVPYAGMSKVADMIPAANEFLASRGIALPLAPQSSTTPADRMEKGLALQKSIFGADHIDRMYETAPAGQRHIQEYLSANCFGDYQTSPVLDVRTRELLTFAILVSLGGCEPQVKGHIQGNVNVGNDKGTLLAVVTQLLPYIGYPRTLNAVTCLNETIPENK